MFEENKNEKSRYTETQIVKILKEVEAGWLIKEICRARMAFATGVYITDKAPLLKLAFNLNR